MCRAWAFTPGPHSPWAGGFQHRQGFLYAALLVQPATVHVGRTAAEFAGADMGVCVDGFFLASEGLRITPARGPPLWDIALQPECATATSSRNKMARAMRGFFMAASLFAE